MVSIELTLFERFVEATEALWLFLEQHHQAVLLIYLMIAVSNWITFRYHYAAMFEPRFVMTNLEIAGRFSKPSYDMWKWLSVSFVPFGSAVVVFTIVTCAKSQPFLAAFGIKGSGRIKKNIVYRSVGQYTWIGYLKHLLPATRKEKDYQTTTLE